VLERRTQLVAKKITQFLKATNRFDKTIVFCEDIDHAERMRQALVNENSDLVAQNSKYVMRITGDNAEGKAELDNFILPESQYPVIATTSKLMTTGVDAQTKDINSVVARLNIQGLPANIKNSQQLKSRLVAEVAQAKETVRPKAEAAWAERRFALVKNFVKWFLGALVSGALFVYIWRYTRWARRGSRFSK
jgi:hypothetical protein